MPRPSLFVGVVSHTRTRFPTSQGPDGLAARIAARVPGSTVRVNTSNLAAERPVAARTVQRSLSAELRVEWAWDGYLGRSWRYSLVLALRWMKRAWRSVRPPAPSTIRRLLNIELSHRDLWGAGLASGADWVLILEDDGDTNDVEDLVQGIAGIIAAPSPPSIVNLSRSFTPSRLRAGHLLTDSGVAWQGPSPRDVLTAARPITNTVCAVLYSSAFLTDLVETWDAMPMEPVLPIDWKLNVVLMAMHADGSFPERGCWFVEPAPIVQGSMLHSGNSRAGILG